MKPIAQTKQIPLAELTPYPANPRRGDVAAIRASLERSGQYRAIVVRADTREVLAGNHALAAMLELGYEKALVHLVDVDDEQARAIVLADNRTAELAGYDEQALADLLAEVDDLAGTGWDQAAVDELTASLAPDDAGRDTEPVGPPEVPRSKPGDLWVLGEHRVLCGDATKAEDVQRLMGGEKAEMMATDPPYGVDYGGLVGSRANQKEGGWRDMDGDALSDEGLLALLTAGLAGASASTAFVWHPAGARRRLFWEALEANGWRVAQEIVWVKNAMVFGRADYQWRHEPCLYAKRGRPARVTDRTQTTVWEVAKTTGSEHPTQKPVELFEIPARNHTEPGDIVYDPFAGSGSTLIACENLHRRCYALEISAAYVDVIVDRFERHTGQTATRDG